MRHLPYFIFKENYNFVILEKENIREFFRVTHKTEVRKYDKF